ncbi:hypothetical protein OSB04_018336 [Centaurea solstitialis]|uniref:Uncharacterized protein n=1 Tax=Centaurea solstitialis TaxID=347529 RepID=A0AA38TFJ3_9ASTR|nr:hypothetical protein OSB04_018336 [Centaurea solstitialis]
MNFAGNRRGAAAGRERIGGYFGYRRERLAKSNLIKRSLVKHHHGPSLFTATVASFVPPISHQATITEPLTPSHHCSKRLIGKPHDASRLAETNLTLPFFNAFHLSNNPSSLTLFHTPTLLFSSLSFFLSLSKTSITVPSTS